MTNIEEWNYFLENLFTNAITEYKKSRENEYREKRQEQIDEFLGTNLTADQKFFVEEILFEIGAEAEHGNEIVYKQGLKDCVWLLKNLGVLA